MRLRVLLCVVLAFGATIIHAAGSPADLLLVLAKSENSLVIVDPAHLTIVGRVPVGADPHEVVASADGRVAYISNYERGTGRTIARVDLIKHVALPPIALGALTAPHGVAFAGGKLYFTAEGAKAVARWDPATQQIDWLMGTGRDRTHMVLVSPDLQTVFTSDDGSAAISIIERPAVPVAPSGASPGPSGRGGRGPAPSTWTIDTVKVGPRSEGFALSPDGRELWVANAQQGTISIIDVAQRTVVQTIPSNTRVNRLAFSPDGSYVLVPDLGGTELLVIEAVTRAPVKRITLPGTSEGVVVARDGRHAYATLPSRGSIAVIDLVTLAASGELKTGDGPDGLAWATVDRLP